MSSKPTLTQRVTALEQERSLYRVGLVLLVLAAIGSFAGVYAVVKLGEAQRDIKTGQRGLKDAVHQIQQSRIVLTRQSCRQRNNDRAATRSTLKQNRANLAQIPDAGLHQLGFTRAEAVAQIDKQLRKVAPLDCEKLIKQVAGNEATKPRIGRGGGPGANAAPRPRAQRKPSRRPTGDRGGPSPTQPESPSPGGPRTGPHSGDPPPAGSGGQPSGNGDGGLVEPPTIPHPNPGGIVQSLVDGVGRIVQRLLP